MGVAFFGYRDFFPQGGMNQAGLAFDGLALNYTLISNRLQKPAVGNREDFIRSIMTTCSTVEDVAQYANQYYRKGFERALFFFADKNGHYLVMEPDTILIGKDPVYHIANFCPSTATADTKNSFVRYENGSAFIRNHANDNDPFLCKRLTDTMHVCRAKIGDGTLHSYVGNLDKRTIELFFYHDFSKSVIFDLNEELKKGYHRFDIASLFNGNREYAALLSFQTTFNNNLLRFGLAIMLLMYGMIFIFMAFQKQSANKNIISNQILAFSVITAIPILFRLITDESVFYFPIPYDGLLNSMNYFPTVFLLENIFILYLIIKKSRTSENRIHFHWNTFVLPMNILLLAGCFYWRLFPYL